MTGYGEVEGEDHATEVELASKTGGGVLEEELPALRTAREKADGGKGVGMTQACWPRCIGGRGDDYNVEEEVYNITGLPVRHLEEGTCH